MRPSAVAFATLSLAACSLALTPDEKQCESDQDCIDRGFDGAACVDELCVAPERTGGNGGEGGTTAR